MTGGDPDELDAAARGGIGQAWALTHAAARIDRLDGVRRWRGGRHLGLVPELVTGLRRLGDRFATLDDWVGQVAGALRQADATSPVLPLLQLGVDHPATDLVTGRHVLWADLRPGLLTDAQLDALAATPLLPTTARDLVERERLRRWVASVEDRVAAVPQRLGRSPLDLLVRWLDDRLVDLTSPMVDLHVSAAEQADRLRAEAAGARRLLDEPGVTVLSFEPDRPAARVALGDLDTATGIALLLPGTGTGLHAVDEPLADATALHDVTALHDAADGPGTAVVLDLHPAPADLGRAADPRTGRAAGAATAAFLASLRTGSRRVTLVGHSYGAFTAAHAARATPAGTVDALVLLGAPGVGVVSVADLPVPEVWADRAAGDPIGAVADLDEHVRRIPPAWVPGPLQDPLAGLGPDPTDPEFGARRLADLPADGRAPRGHLDYLTPGSTTLARVAAVVTGRRATRDRPASAGGG